MVKLCAEASTTEEPDEGKLHVRVCAGGAGRPAFLPRRVPIPTLLKTKLAKIAVDKGANTDYYLGHNER